MNYNTIRTMFIEKATTFDAKQEIEKLKHLEMQLSLQNQN